VTALGTPQENAPERTRGRWSLLGCGILPLHASVCLRRRARTPQRRRLGTHLTTVQGCALQAGLSVDADISRSVAQRGVVCTQPVDVNCDSASRKLTGKCTREIRFHQEDVGVFTGHLYVYPGESTLAVNVNDYQAHTCGEHPFPSPRKKERKDVRSLLRSRTPFKHSARRGVDRVAPRRHHTSMRRARSGPRGSSQSARSAGRTSQLPHC
jgi:hypothetical protein